MAKEVLSGLILDGTEFDGKLSFQSQMRIEGGLFKGEIQSENRLIVGKKAHINAHIKVKELVVMGRVEGSISDCDLLEVHEGGQVLADISVKVLNIQPGAVFDGKCTMVTN